MSSFCIGKKDLEYLDVKIAGYAHEAHDYWDGNWVNAQIEINVGGFRGRYYACLRAEELEAFHDAVILLYSFDSKEALFETMEEQLRIYIIGDGLGHFTAMCEAKDQVGSKNCLSFVLRFDQTEIPEILKGLDSVVQNHPVKNTTDK